jgi:hypothetical protein
VTIVVAEGIGFEMLDYFFVIASLMRLFRGLRAPQLALAVLRSAVGHARDENRIAA